MKEEIVCIACGEKFEYKPTVLDILFSYKYTSCKKCRLYAEHKQLNLKKDWIKRRNSFLKRGYNNVYAKSKGEK